MTADIHTKPLAEQLFTRHRDGMALFAEPAIPSNSQLHND